MAELEVRNLTRRFRSGGGVSDVSLRVASGEFLVLLGPSGCGKSTLLRLIAGLERPESGEIEIGGTAAGNDGNDGANRDVAMVFQSFALYPHMSAFDNIAFPLRLRRMARDRIERRVKETAEIVGLAIDLRRYPRELSGGERQRVALARALVREPAVILMDEPLASLDAKLRVAVRIELKEFQRRARRTMVYVTHDQGEALALADRLAVMREGRIEQVATPEEIYARPATEFVAGFVGTPEMNLLSARRGSDDRLHVIDGFSLPVAWSLEAKEKLTVGFRPDDFARDPAPGLVEIDVVVEHAEFAGNGFLMRCRAGEAVFQALSPVKPIPGEHKQLFLDPGRLHFFDHATGRRIG